MLFIENFSLSPAGQMIQLSRAKILREFAIFLPISTSHQFHFQISQYFQLQLIISQFSIAPSQSMQNNYHLNNDSQFDLGCNSSKKLVQIFSCSCGKKYKSFPSLYLHVNSKHRIRLSTKPSEKRKTVRIQNGVEINQYVIQSVPVSAEIDPEQYKENSEKNVEYSPKQNESSVQHCQKLKEIEQCIKEYLRSSDSTLILFKWFLGFIKAKRNKDNTSKGESRLDRIPYMLNQFVCEYLPKEEKEVGIRSRQWQLYCEQLYNFSLWLRKKKYTELIVIYQKVGSDL